MYVACRGLNENARQAIVSKQLLTRTLEDQSVSDCPMSFIVEIIHL